jgi:hypothetical protein
MILIRSIALLLRVSRDPGVIDTVIQLWTLSNAHWYLKQEIQVDSSAKSDEPR